MNRKSLFIRILCFSIVGLFLLGNSPKDIPSKENETIQWPEITKESKPWTRWWWHGSAVNEQGLTAALEAYQKAGLGGVEITPIYGVRGTEKQFIDYLSPQWMEKLVYTLNEAKRLGIGVDMANASGWPFGGPWVNEEIACKNVVSKTFKLQGGQSLTEKIIYEQAPILRTQGCIKPTIDEIKQPVTANKNLQEYAFDQIRYRNILPLVIVTANKQGNTPGTFSTTIDVTDKVKDGILHWTAPAGEWLICALFQGNHGKMVERAGPGGEGNVIDHFSAEALKKYLSRFDEAFAGYDISYLRNYFNDSYEVDDAIGQSYWTPEIFSEFKRLHGYDLRNYLPAFLGLADTETNLRVLYDFRMLISDLLLERYTRNWQGWAAQQGKGIRNQAHGSPANVLDLYAASDIPEIEGNNILNLKSAPSAAHVTGKNLSSSESATWLNEHFQSSLGDVKTCVDRFLLAGVNHVFYHGTTYSPQDAPWPGWLFYAAVHFTPANSFWDDFEALNRYIAHSQSFLQAGRPSNDILLYYGIADWWSTKGTDMLEHFDSFETVSMKDCGEYLLQNGYSWDAISDKQLLDVRFTDAGLIAGGNTYKAVMVPELKYMPVETFEQLMKLAHNGATVLFCKELPSDVPGLSALTEKRSKMESFKKKLVFMSNENTRTARYGKGKVIISSSMSELTTRAGVKAEPLYAQGLQCIRRIKDNGNYYYFIVNPGKENFSGWVPLNSGLASAALYNPMTGKDGFANIRRQGGKAEIYLQLKPGETMVAETFQRNHSGELYPFYTPTKLIQTLNDNWEIKFIKGGPSLPAPVVTEDLKSWTEYGTEYAAFSGTAEYTTHIPVLPQSDAWLLELPEVHESAAVYLNGMYLGTLLNAPERSI